MSGQPKILDLELAVRVAALDAVTGSAIERAATDAFLWRGLCEHAALDLARGLQWLALGQPPRCTSESMIVVLALRPLPADRCHLLGQAVDEAFACGREPDTGRKIPVDEDLREAMSLGRRLSLVLDALAVEELPDPA